MKKQTKLPGVLDKWQKTPAEMKELWGQARALLNNMHAYAIAESFAVVSADLPQLQKVLRTIERAQVAAHVSQSTESQFRKDLWYIMSK